MTEIKHMKTKSEKPKLLCVDDDQDNLSAVEAILSQDFEVLTFRSALEALEHLNKDSDFTIILSDQRMPEMNGVDFLEETLKINPKPIRILFTGYSDFESAIEAINRAQIYRYLTKPWAPTDLILTLKEAAEKFNLSNEVKLKNEQLQKAISDLQAMDKIKTNFMILINHELKTPLTAINSYLELLKEEIEDNSQKKYLQRIEEGCERLKFLTDEVVYLLNNNNEALENMVYELSETNIVELLRPYKNNENFRLTINTNELTVPMSEKILKNVLERLIQNSSRFKNRGIVEITVNDAEDDIVFEISNYSDEYTAEDLKRVLEPFEFKRNVMNHSKGLGLGLPIVQVLLKKIGSDLTLSYKNGKFTALFIIRKRALVSDSTKLNFI
jgi:two-component system, sensor histidine kinase and response regulator